MDLNFQKVTLESLPVLAAYLRRAKNRNCNFCVGNNFLWSKGEGIEYAIFEDTLIYRLTARRDCVAYRLPEETAALPRLLPLLEEDAKAQGRDFVLTDVSKALGGRMRELFPEKYELKRLYDYDNYVYLVSDLTNLSGRKYHGKKNHVNKFRNSYDFVYESMNEGNIEECRAVENEWRAEKLKNQVVAMLSDEQRFMEETMALENEAIDRAFGYFGELGLVGGLLRVDGRVAAFTIGERLTEDTFVTHYEKAGDLPGIYSMINQQFMEHELQEYTYVNREEDMGLSGLRQVKESYHPVFMEEVWEARPKER